MADQRERIVLEIDETEALNSQKRVNAEIDRGEKLAEKAIKTVGRMAETESRAILSVTGTRQSSIERTLASLEKRASFAGKTGAERLLAERELTIRRVAGDERAVERVKAAFDRLIASEEKHISLGQRIGNVIRNPLQAAGEAAESLAAKFGTIGIVASAAAAGIGLAAKAAFSFVSTQAAAAEATSNLADRLGVTVGQAEQLSAMAKNAGVAVGSLEGFMRGLSTALVEGSEEGDRARQALAGIAFDSRGGLKSTFDILRGINGVLAQMNTPEKVNFLSKISRSGLELLPLFKRFEESLADVRALGVGLEDNLNRPLDRADQHLDKISTWFDQIKKKAAEKIVISVELIGKVSSQLNTVMDVIALSAPGFGSGQARGVKAVVDSVPSAAAAAKARSIEEGTQLAEQFRKQLNTSEDRLAERLRAVTAERKKAEGFLVAGIPLEKDVVQQKIADAHRLIAEEKSLTAQIKARAEAEQKADAARKAFETHRKALPDAQTKAFAEVEREIKKAQQERFGEESKQREETNRQIRESIQERVNLQAEMEAAAIEARRDHELAVIDSTTNQSLQSRIDQIRRRAEVETRAQQELSDLELRRIAEVQQRELDSILFINDTRLKQGIITLEQYQAAVDAFTQTAATQAQQIAARASAAQAATRERAVNQEAELIRDAHMRAFESVKRGAEGLLDQLLSRSQSFGDALGAILKAAILTPLKDAASTLIASLLTGVRPAGGGGGILGGLLGGSGGASGLAGILGSGRGGGTAGASRVASAASAGGFFLPNGRGFALTDPAAGLTASASGSTLSFGNTGAPGGLLGAGLLAGGAFLAGNGLSRGGLRGLGQTALGGAAVGFAVGGPAGAAVGFTVGLYAGVVRLFMRGAESKIVDKIKSVYGLTISKQFARDPLLPIIKQQFGGNVDVGIRSPAIRDLIELYAMSTGQNAGGIVNRVQPVSLAQSRGVLTQVPNFFNGSPLPTGGGAISSAPSVTVNFTMPAEAVNDAFDGRTQRFVVKNPRVVQGANQKATQQSAGRREMLAMQFAPGTITS